MSVKGLWGGREVNFLSEKWFFLRSPIARTEVPHEISKYSLFHFVKTSGFVEASDTQ